MSETDHEVTKRMIESAQKRSKHLGIGTLIVIVGYLAVVGISIFKTESKLTDAQSKLGVAQVALEKVNDQTKESEKNLQQVQASIALYKAQLDDMRDIAQSAPQAKTRQKTDEEDENDPVGATNVVARVYIEIPPDDAEAKQVADTARKALQHDGFLVPPPESPPGISSFSGCQLRYATLSIDPHDLKTVKKALRQTVPWTVQTDTLHYKVALKARFKTFELWIGPAATRKLRTAKG
jgi:hypothetical protein